MKKTNETFLNNKWKRALIVVFALASMYLVSYLIDPFASYWRHYFDRSVWHILLELFSSFLFCLLFSESSILTSAWLNKYIRWTEHPVRRLLVETALNLLLSAVINLIICYVFYNPDWNGEVAALSAMERLEQTKIAMQWILSSTVTALLVMGLHTGSYLIQNWRDEAVKAAGLNQIVVEAELQALKLQIDPHFVFNNLSVLSELILESQHAGYEYAENFSRIYRYMLVSTKQHLIGLAEELRFLHSYIFLIKHRVGEGVTFDIQVQEKSESLLLPPLTLQLVIENALKHNKTLKNQPLRIRIYSQDVYTLVVENNLQPIEKPLDSPGLGLPNIVRRYKLLDSKEPEILQNDASFKVILPLIKP